ncbi:MAG: hypothetical protein HONBIEJF_00220 [Fimbriimonadaceae bacterium]|nr:hypothetical protein [Fimbriimonadaceae bacterium]
MGGRVSDMAFAPGNPKTFVVGYASGGLWITRNRGTTFTQLFRNEETSSIGAVAVCDAPPSWKGWGKETKDEKAKQGKAKIIWVGTGEGNGRNSSSWGNGMYRSTDGGETWDHLGLEHTHDIPRIAVDPRDPDTCYVAALGHLWGHNESRGLYKTTDGGKTWNRILFIDEKTGCCDVIIDPKNPDVVYAAMYMRLRTNWSFDSGGPEGGIYKSTDAGMTWKKLAGGLPKQTGRIGIDIFPGDTQKLIAVVESTETGANSIRDDRQFGGGVFRSEDGGTSWSRHSVRSPRAFYFAKIKFDPKNDKRVYMLGWTCEVSDDGGNTFRNGFADLLHADHHAILIDPNDPDHIIIGTDGGVSQSFDRGKMWDFLNTMPTGQFYNIELDDSDPYRIIGGLQDNGTWLGPSATNKNQTKNDSMGIAPCGITNHDWQVVVWGDGFHADFDPSDPDLVFGEWQGGNLVRVNLKTAEKRFIAPEAREGQSRFRFNWNSPFVVSAHNPKIIYHAGNYVFRLSKGGDNWERISEDLTTRNPDRMETVGSNAETYCTVVSLAESPIKKGILWAGSDDGLIHVTRDDGKSWANVTPAIVDGRYVSRLEASAHAEGRCYATVDGHRVHDYTPCVLVTDDFGKSWRRIDAGLPDRRSCHVIREHPDNPNLLVLGTENALWISLDRGESWTKLHGEGLPTVPINDIKVHRGEKDIVLGTHGLSIWVLDGAGWLSELNADVLEKPLHLFTIADCLPKFFLEYSGLWTHKLFRAPNPPMGVRIDYWISAYTGDDLSISVENADGVVVKKLGGSNAPGYNRVTWDLTPEEWQRLNDKGEDLLFMPFQVAPGTYTVKLTMGKLKAEGKFQVLGRRA